MATSIALQQSQVKQSLFQFIRRNFPTADLNLIDDVVLPYVTSILEEASHDPCFDVEAFIEMVAAYVPQFSTIDPGLVCSWVLELEAELSNMGSDEGRFSNDDSGEDSVTFTLRIVPTTSTARPARALLEPEPTMCSGGSHPPIEEYPYAKECEILQEMFPNACAMEIKHCVTIARGDAERAAATLLLRREQGQEMSAAALATTPAPVRNTQCNDFELRSRIIARYSYVDSEADTKEHKPVAPKMEPKKLVRYRDNKIVSLKGERYTEVSRSGVDEEHLKKPKKQHCP